MKRGDRGEATKESSFFVAATFHHSGILLPQCRLVWFVLWSCVDLKWCKAKTCFFNVGLHRSVHLSEWKVSPIFICDDALTLLSFVLSHQPLAKCFGSLFPNLDQLSHFPSTLFLFQHNVLAVCQRRVMGWLASPFTFALVSVTECSLSLLSEPHLKCKYCPTPEPQ